MAHKKFKSSSNIHDYRHFSLFRAQFKFESKKCYQKYIEQTKLSLTKAPRDFWKFVKNSRSNNIIPRVLYCYRLMEKYLPASKKRLICLLPAFHLYIPVTH